MRPFEFLPHEYFLVKLSLIFLSVRNMKFVLPQLLAVPYSPSPPTRMPGPREEASSTPFMFSRLAFQLPTFAMLLQFETISLRPFLVCSASFVALCRLSMKAGVQLAGSVPLLSTGTLLHLLCG